jgi:phage terminase large subunit
MPSLQIVLGKPQPKQREMMLALEKYVLFGGARGGGKSWTVREKAKRLAIKWAGIKILIIRKTYVDLRDNHILPLRA